LRRVNNENEWGKHYVVSKLKISHKKAANLIKALELKRYIEHTRVFERQKLWRKTLQGSTFSLSSAAKPVTRKTADRIFSEFMNRVKRVNDDRNFLIKVKKVVVFGSYLTEAPKVNDIDVAVELAWKEDHPKVFNKDKAKLALDLALKAENRGRSFGTFVDRLFWPEQQVKSFLKSRSRTLSLHPIQDQILDQVEHKVVFSD